MPPARRPIAACVLPVSCTLSACFPAVTHGPRVERGLAAGLTGAYTAGDTHVEGDEGGVRLRQGVVGPYVGYGWAPATPRHPGAYLGLAVPVLFVLAQADAYVQAPPAWTGPLAAGAGVVASAEGATVYGQAGRTSDRGAGWHLSVGHGRRSSWSRLQSSSPAWVGTAAVQLAAGHLRTQLFVQGAAGRTPGRCDPGPPAGSGACARGARAASAAVGATLGVHRRRAGDGR